LTIDCVFHHTHDKQDRKVQMNRRRTRRIRLLTPVSVLCLAGSMLSMAAAPAGAASASRNVGWAARESISAIHGRRAGTATAFTIHNLNSGLCLGISGGRDNAPAVQWNCNGHPDQIWQAGSAYGNTGFSQLINGNGQCLGVAGGSTAAGAHVVSWTCNTAHQDQYWRQDNFTCAGGYFPILNLSSNLVLGVSGNSFSAGAAVVIWPFQNECNNQFWVTLL
jgi:Ricin-type beta-trefoil lectin domain